ADFRLFGGGECALERQSERGERDSGEREGQLHRSRSPGAIFRRPHRPIQITSSRVEGASTTASGFGSILRLRRPQWLRTRGGDPERPPRPPSMPRRDDLKSILIIGSGPIVIGQACEFDYSGTQACKALREEGYRVILVNSNPATIMTDPETADAVYIEPITVEAVTKVLEKERPDAILPTLGGQTGLNTGLALHDAGVLDRLGIEMIGARAEVIRKAEDRDLFRG